MPQRTWKVWRTPNEAVPITVTADLVKMDGGSLVFRRVGRSANEEGPIVVAYSPSGWARCEETT